MEFLCNADPVQCGYFALYRACDRIKDSYYFNQMMIDEIEMEVDKENARKEAIWKKQTPAMFAFGGCSDVRNDSGRTHPGSWE